MPLRNLNPTAAVVLGTLLSLGGLMSVDAAAQPPTVPPSAYMTADPLEVTPRLDLRVATRDQLLQLPGIGPARAEAILRLRGVNRLSRLRDLRRVRGIGPRTLRRLRPLVRISSRSRRDRLPPRPTSR